MGNYGGWSLLPIAVVIVLVLWTKRTTLSLLAGTLAGAWLLYGPSFPKPWIRALYGVLGSDLWIWLLLVCGFFGSLVALFQRSGGIAGFTKIAARLCRTEKKTLLVTWLLGVVIFIDDWLSILTVSAAMRQATDRFRIPREMLAFLSNVTASSICVLVPISTWGVFMTSQLVSTRLSAPENGMATFVHTLLFLFYPLSVLLCGVLFAAGILPKIGPMKNAAPFTPSPWSPAQGPAEEEAPAGNPWNFILPVALITAITILTKEILYGTFACLIFCALLYLPQRRMTLGTYLDTVLAGFKDMCGVIFILTSAFLLRDINQLLGMPEFVIGAVKNSIPPQLLPAAAFLLVTALGFAAGNFWGICAIAFPVIIPIAQALDANLLLTAGALISATTASSNLCFYGSEATLACSGTQIENIRYAQTAIPMLSIPLALACVGYLLAGAFL